ncbi:triacylglycerol lipase OBL1-like [Zingiber officinale]|uniref:Fungal lipase-type domain-containing protein n=1 Tax=Zingiber officinale TaxID=94328 RepID=A0A8J5KXT4_ZINOF|nr:triacylglycerol lipase OBL1-like [Zingiber officinale]KAG6494590.1 hypothetical protein ZIOFF_042350 [Zingiber officinale]
MDSNSDHPKYMSLRPDQGGVLDLFRILYSPNLSENRFFDRSAGVEIVERWWRRRLVLVFTLLLQIMLLTFRKPLAWLGDRIELLLNFVAQYPGFAPLLINFIKGKRILPERNSSKYRSAVWFLDPRDKLDSSIEPGDAKYHAALSSMASKLAYENESSIKSVVTDDWNMEFLGFYDCWNDYQRQFSTQAFMLADRADDPELIVVAFRGTNPFEAMDWYTDFDVSWHELPDAGKVHEGFLKGLGLQRSPRALPKEAEGGETKPYAYYAIRDELRRLLRRNAKAKFLVTGHSLGGALAVLFPAVLAHHGEEELLRRLEGVYTFGQPRVGDEVFGEFAGRHLEGRYFRYVYSNDIVPRVPFDDSALLFKHFGACFYFDSLYRGKLMEEEPNKNYFSLWELLPRYMNAVWELVRSFLMGRLKGAEYEEGWLLRFVRLCGILLPGVSSHLPGNYVNCVRLASN